MAGELVSDVAKEKNVKIWVMNFNDGTCATIAVFSQVGTLSETDGWLVENGIVTNKYLDLDHPDFSYEQHFNKKPIGILQDVTNDYRELKS